MLKTCWLLGDQVLPTAEADIFSIFFVNSQMGWAVGYQEPGDESGRLSGTADGGETWYPQTYEGPAVTLHTVFFYNATFGWAAGEYGTIVRTTDGGVTWSRLARCTQNEALYDLIVDLGPKYGFVVGEAGVMCMSTDGGAHWFDVSKR